MNPRVPDIAKAAGIAASSAYQILAKPEHERYAESTRRRVLEIAKKMGYQPNAAARALSTQRTGQIGFILSDAISAGWGCSLYGQMLEGVESACKGRGYSVVASRYNLTDLESFVFPRQVGQRSVDGVVLTGYLEAAVVKKFKEFGVPCFCIGDDVEVSQIVPTFMIDGPAVVAEKMAYACTLGHRRFMSCIRLTPRQREVSQQALERVQQNPGMEDCTLRLMDIPDHSDPSTADAILEQWLAIPEEKRPTCIMSTDRVLARLLGLLAKRGIQCPRDVSLLAFIMDSFLCEACYPSLTSTFVDVPALSSMVTNTLLDHLEANKKPDPKISRQDFPHKLVIRESCGPVKK